MKENSHPTKHVTDVPADTVLDLGRIAIIGHMVGQFIGATLKDRGLPGMLNRNVLRDTHAQLDKCSREIRRSLPQQANYLTHNLSQEKIADMATIIDAMARIGSEEKPGVYEDFLGVIVDMIDAIFYAQENRQRMAFAKYRAIFNMLSEEIRREVNGETPQILYFNKRGLYLRSESEKHSPEIKE